MKWLLPYLLFAPLNLLAQKKDTVFKYLNAHLEFTTKQDWQYLVLPFAGSMAGTFMQYTPIALH